MTEDFHENTHIPKMVNLREERIGLGIFPFSSLINHSCKANTISSFDQNLCLTVRATELIQKQEQIFTNYGPDHVRLPNPEKRQKILKDKFFFECTCEACSRHTFEGDQPSHVLPKKEFSELLKQATIFTDSGNVRKAIELLWMALELCKNKEKSGYMLGQEHATVTDALARAHVILGKPEEAAKFLEDALRSVELVYGENSVEVGNELFKIAQLLFNTKQINHFFPFMERAKTILEIHFGAFHEDVVELEMMKDWVKNYLGGQ
eukprot:TRINITY_DN3946_c0_g1_i11.p1 TRINITY_DN3946_c0_g1~~TRINITY_DN3946_c0_g1_i11.p1  ORF type:complete len:264 (-),score=63.12 TRINITY_DN3946_c0_g1_i11:30-821(-)